MSEPARNGNGTAPAQPGAGGTLDPYDRYARVLAAQLDALGSRDPDLDRFHELAEERDRIAQEIEAEDPVADTPPAQQPTVAARLEELRALDRQVVERLAELRADTVQALQSFRARGPDRNSYLATARARTESAHFDVTF
jgi:hypothetical protein